MKNLTLISAIALLCIACGNESSTTSSALISGTGSIKNIQSIEYNGIALVDSADSNLMFDVSEEDDSVKSQGNIVKYEFPQNTKFTSPAGVPQKVPFSRLTVIGVEN